MIFQIALRNVFRHKIRSLVTMAAVVFSCTTLIFVGGFFEDIYFKLRENSIRCYTGHLQIYREGYYEKGSSAPFDYMIPNYRELLSAIGSIPGVTKVQPEIRFASILSNGDHSLSCMSVGMEPQVVIPVKGDVSLRGRRVSLRAKRSNLSFLKNVCDDFLLKNRLLRFARNDTSSSLPRNHTTALTGMPRPPPKDPFSAGITLVGGKELDAANPLGLLLGKGLAEAINVKSGDPLVLLTRTVSGSINGRDMQVRGIFQSGSKDYDDHFLRVPLSTAQELLRTEDIQSLTIFLDKTEDTIRVKNEILSLISTQQLPLEVKSWDELSDFYSKARTMFESWFFVLKIVISIIVILSITNTMNMVVIERTTEIGTLMALGSKKKRIVALFLCEGGLIGFLGGLLGIGVGALFTWGVRGIGIPMPTSPGFSFSWVSQPILVPSVMAFSFFLSLVTSLVSSVIPAWRASRLEIAQALRYTT